MKAYTVVKILHIFKSNFRIDHINRKLANNCAETQSKKDDAYA